MPLYEYECGACGRNFEVIQKFSETTEQCRLCGKGPVRRLLSSPAIQFKGTGWYVTDYAQKGKSGDSAAGTDSAAASEKKPDGSKPESGTKAATPASSTSTTPPAKD